MIFKFKYRVTSDHTRVNVFAGQNEETLHRAGTLVLTMGEWSILQFVLQASYAADEVTLLFEEENLR